MSVYSVRADLIPLAKKIILKLCKEGELDEKKLKLIRNRITRKNGGVLPKNLELVQAYRELLDEGRIGNTPHVLKVIQKRKVRTLSGIANITVLTKDLGCPGQCIYCPTEKGMPKSYLSNEPAMMRAVRNEFDAYKQVKTRLRGLVAQGHDITKIDIRIAGGTWGTVPEWYRIQFLSGIYRALNEGVGDSDGESGEPLANARGNKTPTASGAPGGADRLAPEALGDSDGNSDSPAVIPDSNVVPTESVVPTAAEGPTVIPDTDPESQLADLIKQNETAECRCVGLWVETRPDWVTEEEIRKLRSYGVTGVELGIQTTDDRVNEFCKRGHGLAQSIRATGMLRDAGFKICHHLMPNLPTATLESDLKSGRDLFENPKLRPDYLKIYPTMVTPFSKLSEMIKADPSIHTAYTDDELMNLIAEIKKHVPEYCRIIRVIRDFPAESIETGSKKSNLRQVMQRRGITCRCVRCREIQDAEFETKNCVLKTQEYEANGGQEIFITIEEPNLDKLIGLCRLRLQNKKTKPIFDELKGAALVRELHIYGRQKTLSQSEGLDSNTQHLGFGRQLMGKTEELAKQADYAKIAVIAAIGTREYYRKLGYRLEGTYMVKYLL